MKIPTPLVEGVLLRRYQRFLADIKLTDGTVVTAHTPNTGSMKQCAVPGYRVLLSRNNNPKRKLVWTLERIRVGDFWVDTHTHRANRVVEEGLHQGLITEFAHYRVQPEFRFGHSRIDFLLDRGQERVLLEVKNVTLVDENATALFPDAVTTRGQKHLQELEAALTAGYRSVIFFLVQRGEAQAFSPADAIDPIYGKLLRDVTAKGVLALAYKTRVTADETTIAEPIPVVLPS